MGNCVTKKKKGNTKLKDSGIPPSTISSKVNEKKKKVVKLL